MLKRKNRLPAQLSRLALFVAFATCVSFAAKGRAAGGADEVEEPTPGFAGVSLSVRNSTIPPGGLFQYQLTLTEPKPIGRGSTRPNVPPGNVRGISLNDPAGQTAGVAIINDSGIQFNFNSPLATFGTNPNTDYPIITIAIQLPPDIPIGQQFPLSIDLDNSFWIDSTGQPYPQEFTPGKLTIGGEVAISDVVPGSGLQPAGSRISIFGMGFNADSRVNIEGTNLTVRDWQVISPTQIDVVLPAAVQMEGNRVRVKNKAQTSTYFTYLRTTAVGQSAHPLVAQTYPLFARQEFTSASLSWEKSGSQFTALALQNPTNDAVNITLALRSTAGDVLESFNLPLPARSRINRDLAEFFPQASPNASTVFITSSSPIQMLGLLGDGTTGDIVPVAVTAQ